VYAQLPASQAPARISIHAAARSKEDQITALYVVIGVVIAVVWIAGGILMQQARDAETHRKRGTVPLSEYRALRECVLREREEEQMKKDDES
jgi:hypothetical protein